MTAEGVVCKKIFNETVSETPSAVSLTAPTSAMSVSHRHLRPLAGSNDTVNFMVAIMSAVSSARSVFIITGVSSLVTGTVGTSCPNEVNASVTLGCVTEVVGDADTSTSDKIGITISGNC